MRILCVADLHLSGNLSDQIVGIIKKNKVDVYLDAGDFLNEEFAKKHLSRIKIKGFAVPGNWDTSIDYRTEYVTYSPWHIELYDGYCFVLIGNYLDPTAVKELLDRLKDVSPEKTIVLSHHPPFNILDRIWSGAHIGDDYLRDFVEKKKPLLHVFGHIHEANGVVKQGRTLFINCSLIERGKGYIVDTDKLAVEELQFRP